MTETENAWRDAVTSPKNLRLAPEDFWKTVALQMRDFALARELSGIGGIGSIEYRDALDLLRRELTSSELTRYHLMKEHDTLTARLRALGEECDFLRKRTITREAPHDTV